MKMICHSHANKTHFHKKGFTYDLILKVRGFGTRKWPKLSSRSCDMKKSILHKVALGMVFIKKLVSKIAK